MERLMHVIPDSSYEDQAREYIEEHYRYNSNINGVGGLNRYQDNYQEWLNKLERDRNMIPNEERVPADTYYLVRVSDNRIVGMLNLRRVLNERLERCGGHIGYGIRPTERGQGYNKINLYLGLLRCQELGLTEVILDADEENIASWRTMAALGGVLTNTYYDEEDECMVRRYTINVDDAINTYSNIYEERIVRRR